MASILAASLMVVVGFFLAYIIERSTGFRRWLLSLLVLLPLAFPALMIGIGAIRFWNHPWNPLSNIFYDQPPMLIATYFARFIPIAVLSLRSSLSQVDPSMEEASLVSGSGFLSTVRRVLLPMCWRGLWVAFLLGYVLSMRELDTIAIIGAGNNTLPFRIYSQIHTSRDVIIAAHCIVLVSTLLVPPLIFRLFTRGRVKII
jgi:iron(III) transport system permease protein